MMGRFKNRRRSDQDPGMDDWLMTYADMITLLLCFFAVFLSVSQPRSDKLEEAQQEVKKVFSDPEDIYQREIVAPADNLPSGSGILPANPFGLISTNRNVDIIPGSRVTTIEMNSSAFFTVGSAQLNPDGRKILGNISSVIKNPKFGDYRVIVEGHTDDSPINTAQYPSNWELSTARAASVVRLLIEDGFPPARLQAAGYADTFPKLPNRDASGIAMPDNQAQNRRVLIRLEKIDHSDQ